MPNHPRFRVVSWLLVVSALLCPLALSHEFSPPLYAPLALSVESEGAAASGIAPEAGLSWYRFANHTHTEYSSDSTCSVYNRIAGAAAEGADAISITDHGVMAACSDADFAEQDGCVPMCGEEWGSPVEGDAGLLNLSPGPNIGGWDLDTMVSTALARGATIIANHPFISSEPWCQEDLHLGIAGVEVWTTVLFAVSGGEAALDWWDGFVSRGRVVFAIGGSDNHTDTPFSLQPCNHVLAASAYPDDLQTAIEAGRIAISSSASGSRCFLWVDPNFDGNFVPMGANLNITDSRTVRFRFEVYDGEGLSLEVFTKDGLSGAYTIGQGDPWALDLTAPVSASTKDMIRAEVRTGNAGYPIDGITNPVYVNYTPDDADGDGLSNAAEEALGLDKYVADEDGDGVSDAYEVGYDGDGANYNPYHPENNPSGTDLDVLRDDTDGDGFTDSEELLYGSSPLDASDEPQLPAGAPWCAAVVMMALGLGVLVRTRRAGGKG